MECKTRSHDKEKNAAKHCTQLLSLPVRAVLHSVPATYMPFFGEPASNSFSPASSTQDLQRKRVKQRMEVEKATEEIEIKTAIATKKNTRLRLHVLRLVAVRSSANARDRVLIRNRVIGACVS